MKVTMDIDDKLWVLIDLLTKRMSKGTKSAEVVVNRLLEKALRLSEEKREWIGVMVENDWTIEEVLTIGIGNPSGRAGIRMIYNEQVKVQELQKTRK